MRPRRRAREGRIARHLSYANVMATVAVFIALGGTSYAVSQISGSQIKNRSIPGAKLKLHTISTSELRDLVVSTGHKRRHSSAAIDTGSPTQPAIVGTSIGQSATVLQSGPFSYSVECTAGSSGQPLVTIRASSTETGSLLYGARDSSGQFIFSPEPYPLTAGQAVIASGPPSSDQWDFLINGAHMIAPSGAALVVQLSYGTNLYGDQCWASGYGVS